VTVTVTVTVMVTVMPVPVMVTVTVTVTVKVPPSTPSPSVAFNPANPRRSGVACGRFINSAWTNSAVAADCSWWSNTCARDNRMPAQDNDAMLVARVQRGDKQAFNLLVAKHQYRIRALIARMVAEPAEVEDLVQEAFIKAYRALGGFRGDSAFYTWLYRIAVNTAKHHLAGLAKRPPLQELDDDEQAARAPPGLIDANTPEALARGDQLVATIGRAIDALPAELSQALTLRELEGLSYEDIAEVMRCPIGTVRSRIFRAREAIQEAIAPLLD